MAMAWQSAHRVAAIAAAQAHGDLGIDTTQVPVEVGESVHRAGVPLMYRPLPTLFGVYLNGTSTGPGILVNNALTLPVRRHTAAHELGHHRFGHASTVEAGADADDPSASLHTTRQTGWSDEEKTAEAFASWFLMPRRGMLTVLDDMGLVAPETAAQVYQLGLRLGVTFAAVVRHLAVLKLITHAQARSWAAIAPATFKRRLAGNWATSTRGIDVWDLAVAPHLTPSSIASPGDIVTVTAELGETCSVSGPAEVLGPVDGGWAARCDDPGDADGRVTLSTSQSSYSVGVAPRPSGIYGSSDLPPLLATKGRR
jgi:Zn-dependent peptidase ImmA (M78 family)